MSNAFNKDQTIQNTTPSGNPPRSRIASADAAYAVFDRMRDDSRPIAWQRARIKGQQDGKAPFDSSKRRETGNAWMSNVNMRRARANVRLNSASVWNMLMSTRVFIDLTLSDAKLKDPQEPSINPGDIVAEEFTRILRDDRDFIYNTLLVIKEMEQYGGGPCMWRNEWIWRADFLRNANVFFPSKTKSQPGKQEIIAIRDERSVIDIYEDAILNPKAEEMGWKPEAVKKALIAAFDQGQRTTTNDPYTLSEWESVEERMTLGDYWLDRQFDGLVIIHELVVEGDGKVTHLIISENTLSDNENAAGDQPARELLFKQDRRWDCITHVFQNMLFDVGDGFLKSVKGLAFELFPTEDMYNRLFNATMDGVNMSTGLLLQPQTGDDAQSMALIRRGPVTILPSNVDVIQSSFQPPIDKAIAALGLLSNVEQNNTGIFKTQQETVAARRPRSATEVELEAQNEARFQSNQAAWIYVQWEMFLKETFRRLINSDYPESVEGYEQHKLFIQRCKDRGVDTKLLKFDVWTVRAKRAIGYGSPALALRDTQSLLSIAGSLDERGRMNAIRDWIEVRFGYEAVDRYAPIMDRNAVETNAHSFAAMESNDMAEGEPVPVGTDQPHEIHLSQHLQRMGGDLQKFAAGRLPADRMFAQLQVALPHAQQHVVALSQDPMRKGKAEQFMEALQQIAQQAAVVRKQVEELQKQKQAQAEAQKQALIEQVKQEADREFQLKLREQDLAHQVEMAKTESLNQTRYAKLEASIGTQVRKTLAEIQRKNFESQQEQARKNREASANTAREASD